MISPVIPDLDAGGLCGGDGLFDALHEVLCVADQHLCGLEVLVGPLGPQHCRLHGGQDLELGPNGRNPFTHLEQLLLLIIMN